MGRLPVLSLDKFCRQNFEQNKRFLRRAFEQNNGKSPVINVIIS